MIKNTGFGEYGKPAKDFKACDYEKRDYTYLRFSDLSRVDDDRINDSLILKNLDLANFDLVKSFKKATHRDVIKCIFRDFDYGKEITVRKIVEKLQSEERLYFGDKTYGDALDRCRQMLEEIWAYDLVEIFAFQNGIHLDFYLARYQDTLGRIYSVSKEMCDPEDVMLCLMDDDDRDDDVEVTEED